MHHTGRLVRKSDIKLFKASYGGNYRAGPDVVVYGEILNQLLQILVGKTSKCKTLQPRGGDQVHYKDVVLTD
jgi:hypothetical protein